ncbi:MAG: hypothetical protein ACOYLO_00435 [Ferruginibacter sp.]
MNVWKYFELAKKVASIKDDKRDFLFGAVAIRNDDVLVFNSNGSAVIDKNDRRSYFPTCHAEYRLVRKLDRGAIVFVTRIGGDFSFKNSKPCQTCQNAMRKRGVKKVYYTISNDSYGVIIFKKD